MLAFFLTQLSVYRWVYQTLSRTDGAKLDGDGTCSKSASSCVVQGIDEIAAKCDRLASDIPTLNIQRKIFTERSVVNLQPQK